MGLGLATVLGWSIGAGLLFGLALSVASTVVLLKALQDRHMVESEKGKIAVGWLIVEDLAMVLALVLIPALAAVGGNESAQVNDSFVNLIERLFDIELGLVGILTITVVKLAAFVGFMLVVGRRVIPFILHYTAHTGSRELFRLAVLAIALGVAAGSAYLFGVSLALGAFFAGMILSESELSHRAANETLPLRDAFAVLFFVAVGMLFDPSIIITQPLPVLATVFIIVIGKSVLAFFIVVAFKRAVGTALVISSSLAQIGEFSFILAAMGVALGILPPEGRDLILAGAIISIILNPLAFGAIDLMRPWLEKRFGHRAPEPATATRLEPDLTASAAPAAPEPGEVEADEEVVQLPTRKSGHLVLIGYGRVGTVVAEALLQQQRPFLVIEDADGRAASARAAGIEVIPGNAATPRVLALANVEAATAVFVAIPNAFEAGQVTEQCRKHNPAVLIVARAHSDEEEAHLKALGANVVLLGEREIGLGMVDVVNRDSQAVAEITASDAVAQALAPFGVAPKVPQDPNHLEAAIEAAQPRFQHVDVGPAEPPGVVPALGEEPDPAVPTAPVTSAEAAPVVEAVPHEDPATTVVETVPPPPIEPPQPAPSAPTPIRPATTAGTPFNPEVPPPEENKV
jgi:monovalent cation:H+ antiporter-2, CPA2 family